MYVEEHPSSFRLLTLVNSIKRDRAHDDYPGYELRVVRIHAVKHQATVDERDDESAKRRPDDRAGAACKRRSADYDRGDDPKLYAQTGRRLSGLEKGERKHP